MSGLISRAAILTFSRFSNFAIHLFSPLLLVRILDVTAYGQYQEFMIYSMLLASVCSIAIDSSLTYFIPRSPERERSFVSQTSLITLLISAFCLSLVLLSKPVFLQIASYDFVTPLCAYVFFFVNLNWLEYYWIGKRQANLVLYYSAARLLLRIAVLLLVAYLTRDVLAIAWSLAVAEGCRVLLVFVYFARQEMFVRDMRRAEIQDQLRFAVPIGIAGVVQNAGRSIGKVFISSTLGPASLAYYSVGSYIQPIVRVARSGMEDAVYPELVRAHSQPGGALRLWQRVNVMNCVLLFPAFVVLVYYARPIVETLFTSAYLSAVPVFIVYALFVVRRCFNTDVLLRTSGRTAFVLWGTLGALAINILLIPLLSSLLGLIGPAIAFIAAEVILEIYFAIEARRTLQLRLKELADWASIWRIVVSCAVALPILIGMELLPSPELIRIGLASALYFVAVLGLAYLLGVADVGRIVGIAWSRLQPRSRA